MPSGILDYILLHHPAFAMPSPQRDLRDVYRYRATYVLLAGSLNHDCRARIDRQLLNPKTRRLYGYSYYQRFYKFACRNSLSWTIGISEHF
ncbi:hypothetical protein ACQRIU_005129 [Beauveria bassiana]